jgi:hypothetical protein
VQIRINHHIQQKIEIQLYFDPETHNMMPSQETALSHSILTSKHLIVVLGMNND